MTYYWVIWPKNKECWNSRESIFNSIEEPPLFPQKRHKIPNTDNSIQLHMKLRNKNVKSNLEALNPFNIQLNIKRYKKSSVFSHIRNLSKAKSSTRSNWIWKVKFLACCINSEAFFSNKKKPVSKANATRDMPRPQTTNSAKQIKDNT